MEKASGLSEVIKPVSHRAVTPAGSKVCADAPTFHREPAAVRQTLF